MAWSSLWSAGLEGVVFLMRGDSALGYLSTGQKREKDKTEKVRSDGDSSLAWSKYMIVHTFRFKTWMQLHLLKVLT